MPHTPETFIQSNGQSICYDSFGDRGAAPMLLIMGLGAQMTLWDSDFCEALARRGFLVVRFDNRDIGRSSRIDKLVKLDLPALIMAQVQGKPIAAPYTLRDMAADAAGVLDSLKIPSAHIVGASMGGMIAQEMAIHFPQRVRSLVSIMSSTGAPGLPGPAPEAAAIFAGPPPLTREEYIAQFKQTWKLLRAGSFPRDEARDEERAASFYDRGLNPPGVARQMIAIFASGDRTAALERVRTPTLVIHGDADPLVPLPAGLATAASIPGARMMQVPRMGHALPEEFWPQIIEAIAGHCR